MNEDLDIPVRTYRAAAPDGSKRVLLIAGGIGAVALMAVAGALLARHGHRAREIPVITADPRPVRVKPTDPGGMQVAGQGEDILSGGSDAGDANVMAPGPEAPALGALRARQMDAAAPVVTAAPAAVPEPPPIPPLRTADARADAKAGRVGPEVILGTLPSEADARAEMAKMVKKAPDLFTERAVRLEQAGQAWRLRAGPFPDIATATAFCARARVKAMACSLAAG